MIAFNIAMTCSGAISADIAVNPHLRRHRGEPADVREQHRGVHALARDAAARAFQLLHDDGRHVATKGGLEEAPLPRRVEHLVEATLHVRDLVVALDGDRAREVALPHPLEAALQSLEPVCCVLTEPPREQQHEGQLEDADERDRAAEDGGAEARDLLERGGVALEVPLRDRPRDEGLRLPREEHEPAERPERGREQHDHQARAQRAEPRCDCVHEVRDAKAEQHETGGDEDREEDSRELDDAPDEGKRQHPHEAEELWCPHDEKERERDAQEGGARAAMARHAVDAPVEQPRERPHRGGAQRGSSAWPRRRRAP
jgi:hypothetical protein